MGILDLADKATRVALSRMNLAYPISHEDYEDARQAAAEALTKTKDHSAAYAFQSAVNGVIYELKYRVWGKNPQNTQTVDSVSLSATGETEQPKALPEKIEKVTLLLEQAGSSPEIARRNAEMLARIYEGASPRTLSTEFGMSERVARSTKDRALRKLKIR